MDINSKIVRLPQTYTIQKIRLVSFFINQAVAEANGHVALQISDLPSHCTTLITPAGIKVPCDHVLLAPIDGSHGIVQVVDGTLKHLKSSALTF